MEDKLERLTEIFRDIFEDDGLAVVDTLSTSNYDDWESVAMVRIVMAVESEFGVRFTTDEVAGIKSVADILKKIS